MKRMIVPLTLFILGLVLAAYAVITGEANFALFLIFPVIYGGGMFLLLGIALIFLSFISFFFLSIGGMGSPSYGHDRYGAEGGERTKKETDYGGVIFIGPIPIIFGKDKDTTKTMMYIGLVIALILLFIYLLFFLRLT